MLDFLVFLRRDRDKDLALLVRIWRMEVIGFYFRLLRVVDIEGVVYTPHLSCAAIESRQIEEMQNKMFDILDIPNWHTSPPVLGTKLKRCE